jgi:cell division protein FtsI (penicillin-binding protein 3)
MWKTLARNGMELAQQKTLAGVTGSRRVIKDRLGRIVEDIAAVREPHDGKDLVLSLDSKIQYIAFTHLKEAVEKFKAKAGGAVVLDVHTGRSAGAGQLPSYNPNNRSPADRRAAAQPRDDRHLRARFDAEAVHRGAGAGHQARHPAHQIETGNGKLHHRRPHYWRYPCAWLDRRAADHPEVVQYRHLQDRAAACPQEMWEMFTKVGFGQQPKWGFPGAVAGRVRPYKSWRPIEQATMSYGHGISVSLIQLAHAYMIFARDGDIIPLSFQKLRAPVGQQRHQPKRPRATCARCWRWSRPDGTAPRRRCRATAWAARPAPPTSWSTAAMQCRKYVSVLRRHGADVDPRFIIAVMIDEPTQGGHFGGEVAAPVFANCRRERCAP